MLNTIKRVLGLGSDPFVGSISLFPGNRAPENFVVCDGRPMECNKYPELFSVIGFIYGGNTEKFTFAIPKLNPVGDVKYYICYAGTYPRFRD
jgi:microcystin-dependent protein